MADELNKIDEDRGYTQWGGSTQRMASWFFPLGMLGRFYAKFFASKAQPTVTQSLEGEPPQTTIPTEPLAGDTVINRETLKPEGPAVWSKSANTPVITELEKNRKQRYKEFEEMDEYPEIGTAFDIYADDSTQKGLLGERWKVLSENTMAKEEIENLFRNIKLEKVYWDIIRNTVKYGDCFSELVVDLNAPKKGVQRLKILNPGFVLRVENEYGYLTDFLQEIPLKNEWDSYGNQAGAMVSRSYITLDKNQIVHFRLHTSDPVFYPYGKSVAAMSRQIYRSLRLMEDAMLIYRLSRAPERRIFYVDTGNLPASKAEMYIERLKQKFKKEHFYHSSRGNIDARYNPMSADEDFFVPIKGNSGTKIETLPGAQNLGEVDDVKYFRDKLLATLKIPKDYFVEKDKSPERKANLAQLDVKFARTIGRIQSSIESGLESVAKRHLHLKGYSRSIIDDVRIELPESSDMFIKRKLDVDYQKASVVMQVLQLQLFPKEKIYKDYYDLTDEEIEEIEEKMKDKVAEDMEQQQAMGMGGMPMGGAPMGGMPMEGGIPPEGGEAGPAGELESDENIPPTTNPKEEREEVYKNLMKEYLTEDKGNDNKTAILSRLIRRSKRSDKNS